ncbi:MAG: GNAT family N-acetyltransferase [Candidatus Cloacimonadaceae bacterium]|nr:GNAT family N-acetyltransferase [Candidatus Cloacimonadaceae bacterium]MDP3113743.1 GNAT family N-acetyltransferase [Candidatus Cloacimonadaceae bacterium]
MPFILQRLIDTELQFAKRFTNCVPKDFGLIYWNEGNKESHDSNHAIISDFIGVGSSIKEILSFYKAKGINPRLYPAFKENELEVLTPLLETNSFTIEQHGNQFFLHEKDSSITPVHGIRFERLKTITPELREFVLSDKQGEWAIKVLERHLSHPNYHLLAGFANDALVTLASVNIFVGYSRVDDVYTHHFYRGKGYSSALINYVLHYHKERSDNYLYLYSAIPEAIKVYGKAGFVPIAQNLKFWTAYKEL